MGIDVGGFVSPSLSGSTPISPCKQWLAGWVEVPCWGGSLWGLTVVHCCHHCFLLPGAIDCEAWSMDCLCSDAVDVDAAEVVPVVDVQDMAIELTA